MAIFSDDTGRLESAIRLPSGRQTGGRGARRPKGPRGGIDLAPESIQRQKFFSWFFLGVHQTDWHGLLWHRIGYFGRTLVLPVKHQYPALPVYGHLIKQCP